jgi:putative redox protein
VSENTRSVKLEWTGTGMEFSAFGTQPTSPAISIDGDTAAAPSPVQLLVMACASCSGADVVHILQKMRVDFDRLTIDAAGERREETPQRLVALHLHFHVSGNAVEPEKVERAVSLSIENYCSVIHSLSKKIEISTAVSVS